MNAPASQPSPGTTPTSQPNALQTDAGVQSGSIIGPCAIAFIASAAVMIVELLAFRLIARYLGSSNYTTTAIIGVVLGGLAIGNFIGGSLADRFRVGRMLALLFVLSSAGCFAVPVLNKLVGDWSALWFLSWPRRIALHVTLVFSLPAILLGTIGPVVARMALLRSDRVGRTVGAVYAFGALGSIIGTFACGFYLIPYFGNYAVIQAVGAGLSVMAIVCARTYWATHAWTTAAAVLVLIGAGPWAWAKEIGADLGLRERITPFVIFDADSEYGHVRVEVNPDHPTRRIMVLDKLEHSYLDLARPDVLQYGYENVYAAVTDHVAAGRDAIRALVLGGGGYTHPRHILRARPRSNVEVVEIDPVVTRAAMAAFDLSPQPGLTIVHLDARQHVADLVRRRAAGEAVAPLDFVFLDAVNDFNVPFHLTTEEFQASVATLLGDEGVFLMTLIDIYEVGGFLGSTLRTMKNSFSHVACFYAGYESEAFQPGERYTFIVVASQRDLKLGDMEADPRHRAIARQQLTREQIEAVMNTRLTTILTDDHAPVEFLLMHVVELTGRAAWNEAAMRFYNRGNTEYALKRYDRAIESYRRAIELEPAMHIAHLNLGLAYKDSGRMDKAVEAFLAAAAARPDLPGPAMNLAGIYMLLHEYEAARRTYEQAIQLDPQFAAAYNGLGMALANLGRLSEARAAIQRAIALQPDYPAAVRNLAQIDAAMASPSDERAPATRPADD